MKSEKVRKDFNMFIIFEESRTLLLKSRGLDFQPNLS